MKRSIGIILAIVFLTAFIIGGLIIGTLYRNSVSKPAFTNTSGTSQPVQVVKQMVQADSIPFGKVNTDGVTGTILYISDGDLWQANPDGSERVKLIDRDTVTRGIRSSDGSNIAYSVTETLNEEVTVDDVINGKILDKKETRSFTPTPVFIATALGSDSIPVTLMPISRFGWVPNSRLIWYEESELAYFFDWGYGPNGVIRIYDVDTRKTQTIIEQRGSVFGVQGLNFSPDGHYVAYIGGDLTVTELRTGVTKNIFDIPYVGGDRGGPQPIPTFVWDPDSQSLYTVFTPILFEKSEEFQSQSVLHKSGYVSAYQIFLDERKPKLLFEHKPAPIINDEMGPRIAFSNDFRYVLYYHYEDADIQGLKDVYEWYYNGGQTPPAKFWSFGTLKRATKS